MNDLVKEPTIVEDSNSPLAKNWDSDSRPLSESSIDRGDGYVTFSPEGPETGGTGIVLKWGGNPPEKKQQQKDKGEKGKEQNKDKGEGEKGDKGEKSGKGEGEQSQSEQEDADSQGTEGTEGTGGREGGGKEKGAQSDQKGGGGKGKEKGEEEDGEPEGDGEKGGEKEGKEKDGKDGEVGKRQGGEKDGEEGGKGKVGDEEGGKGRGGDDELGDLDKIRGQDILGGGKGPRGPNDDDNQKGGPRRPPHGPREKGKGKDGNESSKDKTRGKPDRPGEPGDDSKDDDGVVEVSSDITDVPPPGEEDPSVLDVIFGKDKKEVSEKENKIISKSFVFRSGNDSVKVFQIEPKGKFSVGDRKYIKKLADLVYYLYEPYLKAPDVDLDPGVPVISSPISSRGLRSEQPHERPKISYGALSTLDRVDFSRLIVFIDVSGSMDMVMVSRVINSYFQSVFSALKKHHGRLVKVVVVLHGTDVGVFGISSSWVTAAQTIAGVAESSRDLVGMGNGSESTLTHRIVDILRTVSPIPGINQFINGPVPLIWITDFYWVINAGNQLTQFLREKPALLISTVEEPKEVNRKGEETFYSGAFNTARTIMNKVPYGALIYFPSFVGTYSGSFTPDSSSGGGSSVRVYAKGGAYDQLKSRKDKLGQITIVRIR
jgi:hypothetical protein